MDAMGASSVAALDPLRITVSLNALNVDGFTADDFLRANFQVTCELPLASSLTFAIGLGTTLNDIDALVHGIETVAERFARRDDRQLQSAPTMRSLTKSWGMARLSPREAFFAARVQTSLEDAVGRVSAEMLCPYPPGIPVIVPGEEITQDAIEHLLQVVAAGGSVSGASDPSLNALQVLQ